MSRALAERAGTRTRARWVLATTLLFVAALALYRIRTFDTFFHLAAGRYILEHGSIPRVDPFSFTFRGAAWHDHSWGYQLLIAKLHELGGFGALSCLQAALAAATCALALLPLMAADELVPWAALVCAVPYVTFREMLEARPHMLAFACLAATLSVTLHVYEQRRPRRLVWLLPVYVLWASAHGSHLLAWLIALAAAFASALPRARRGSLALGLVGGCVVLVLAGMLVAPDALRLGTEHVASSFLETSVQEWAPVTSSVMLGTTQGLTFSVLALLAIAGAAIELRTQGPRADVLLRYGLGVAFMLIALTAVRMLGLFTLGAAVLWAPLAARTLQRAAREVRAATSTWLGLATLATLGACAFGLDNPFHFGAGLMDARVPSGALAHMRSRGRPKRLYNAYNFGGYLMWERFPAAGVFIDGRAITLYPAAFLAEFERAYADPRAFEALATRYAIDGVLLPSTSAKTQTLLAYLRAHPRYELTFADAVASVFELRARP